MGMQAAAKAIQEVAKLERGLLLANDKKTRRLMETWHATPEFGIGTVTSMHIPLARLGHEAKHEVSGMGKITPTYREAWQEQGGKKKQETNTIY